MLPCALACQLLPAPLLLSSPGLLLPAHQPNPFDVSCVHTLPLCGRACSDHCMPPTLMRSAHAFVAGCSDHNSEQRPTCSTPSGSQWRPGGLSSRRLPGGAGCGCSGCPRHLQVGGCCMRHCTFWCRCMWAGLRACTAQHCGNLPALLHSTHSLAPSPLPPGPRQTPS